MGEESSEKMPADQGEGEGEGEREGEGSPNTLMKMSGRDSCSDDFELLFLIVKVTLTEL